MSEATKPQRKRLVESDYRYFAGWLPEPIHRICVVQSEACAKEIERIKSIRGKPGRPRKKPCQPGTESAK